MAHNQEVASSNLAPATSVLLKAKTMSEAFKISHKSVNDESAIVAAANIEKVLGMMLNGDRKAFKKLNVEDLAILIQFTRDNVYKIPQNLLVTEVRK